MALPYQIGIFIGYIFDILSKISGIKFSISSIRIKKFCSSSIYYSSKKNLDNFESPFSLREGLELTIKKEFWMKLINNFKKRFLNKLFSSVKNRTYIQNSSDIKLVSKNLSNEIEIGVDTEFTWKTYFPILSLIQISTPNTLFILDCLSLKTIFYI